ncbi:unnamed protein product [marine sediment metagenome]|uniref:Uncharacterized protein n=1 Tax=marine sediment metagenome TaxID=412755 RepID=X0U585_9ZZZZ
MIKTWKDVIGLVLAVGFFLGLATIGWQCKVEEQQIAATLQLEKACFNCSKRAEEKLGHCVDMLEQLKQPGQDSKPANEQGTVAPVGVGVMGNAR